MRKEQRPNIFLSFYPKAELTLEKSRFFDIILVNTAFFGGIEMKSFLQLIKFALFSASAGLIQVGAFTLLNEFCNMKYWPAYLISLVLSVLWNFTFNRKFTFKSAANVPAAMAKVFGFYIVFTPISTLLGNYAESCGANEYIILAITMISNFVLEFLFCKFVVYKNKEDTL